MDLTQIRYYLALADTLNFTRAAEQCNVTQPALTKSIQRLEGELGGPLLLRERGHTQLTDLGARMLPLLRRTYEAAEAARAGAQQFRRDDRAQLRLGLGTGVEPVVLVPLIRQVCQRFPHAELTLRGGDAAGLNEWLLASEVDVVLTTEAQRLTERANRWVVFADPVVALLPRDCDLAALEDLDAGALADRELVGRLDEAGRALEDGHGLAAAVRHRGATEEHVHALIRAGMGIGLSTARRLAPNDIVRRAIRPPRALEVVVAAVAGRPMSGAADAFLRLARARDWTREAARVIPAEAPEPSPERAGR